VRYRRIIVRALKMFLGCLCMNGVYALFKLVGLNALHPSRLIALAELGLMGMCGVAVYVFVTNLMRLPQAVFHMDLRGILNRILKRDGGHAAG
jgi:hypothetical protein